MDLLQMLQYPGYLILLLILRFRKVLQRLNPKVRLLMPIRCTQIQNLIVFLPANVKIEQIIPHPQEPAQVNNPLVKLVHLEYDQQVVVVVLLLGVPQHIHDLVLVGLDSSRVVVLHFKFEDLLQVEFEQAMVHSLLVGELSDFE